MAKKFLLTYEISVELTTKDIWPEGNNPDDPGPEDVEALIEAQGGWWRIIRDWDLDRYEDAYVDVVREMPKPKSPMPIAVDGKCICTCADPCPLGRAGMMGRCTEDELKATNWPTIKQT